MSTPARGAFRRAHQNEPRPETPPVFTRQRSDPAWTWRWIRAAAFAVLLIVAGALVYRHAAYADALLRYPYEWDEDEGLSVYYAQRLAAGKPIYVDFDALPMTSACYPPVYPALVSLLVPRFGATLLAGRLVSVASVIGLCVLVIAIVRQETGRWSLGLAAAVLFVGSPFVTLWGPFARVDSLALFLAVGGVWLVRQYPRFRAAPLFGLALLILACYTKYQMALLAPAAFWHLWRANRRFAMISAGALVLAGLAALIGLSHWSAGQFWRSTVTAQATEYSWVAFAQNTRHFLEQHAILLLGPVGLLLFQIHRRDLDVWGAIVLASVLIILLTGKLGATVNYYIPTIVASAICAAIAIDHLLRSAPAIWIVRVNCLVLFLASLQGVIWLSSLRCPTEADRQAGDTIVNMVRGVEGDVLTERRIMFSLLAGRRPQIDACTLHFAYQIGRKPASTAAWPVTGRTCWDPTELIKAIRERRFPLIVLEGEFFPHEVVAAVLTDYRKLEVEPVRMNNWHGLNTYVFAVPQ